MTRLLQKEWTVETMGSAFGGVAEMEFDMLPHLNPRISPLQQSSSYRDLRDEMRPLSPPLENFSNIPAYSGG